MIKIFLFLCIGFTFLGCNSADDSASSSALANKPEAKEDYDDSNFGIYKGVFVGSSGFVYVNINNNGDVSAKMVIDGDTYKFSASKSITQDEDISGLLFTSGSNSFEFNVYGNGEEPLIKNISIASHPNAYVQIFKEYSFAQIKCYTGTFRGDNSGTFNLVTATDGYALGLARPNNETSAIYLDGTFKDNILTGTFEGGTFKGIISSETISGTWQNDVPESGTWSATRKL